MTDSKEFPSNSKMVQKKAKATRHRQSVPVRDEDTLRKEGTEMAKRKIISPVARPRVKKKTFVQRLGNTFLGDDTGNVGQYILWDVLIPAAKSTIQDMVTGGIEMLLFGESSGRYGTKRGRDRGKTVVSYGSYFRDPGRFDRKDPRSREMVRVPGYHNRLNGIVFESRGEAEDTMDALLDLIEEYPQVSIADFYELAGLQSLIEHTDHAWGWDNLSRLRVIRTRDGHELEFPEPIALD